MFPSLRPLQWRRRSYHHLLDLHRSLLLSPPIGSESSNEACLPKHVPHLVCMHSSADFAQTLLHWANYRLRLRGSPPITDWTTELPSGVFLYDLLKSLIPGVDVPDFHTDPKRPIEKIQNLNMLCVAVRAVHKTFPAVAVQDIVMGRTNAALDLMWDLAYAFEIEDRVFEGKSGPAAVIAWIQYCLAGNEREITVSDLNSRFGIAFKFVLRLLYQLCRWHGTVCDPL